MVSAAFSILANNSGVMLGLGGSMGRSPSVGPPPKEIER